MAVSTSEVQRWIISPVRWSVCHLKDRYWTWRKRVSLRRFVKYSVPLAADILDRKPKTAAATAHTATARAHQMKCSLRPARPPRESRRPDRKPGSTGSASPRTESTVKPTTRGRRKPASRLTADATTVRANQGHAPEANPASIPVIDFSEIFFSMTAPSFQYDSKIRAATDKASPPGRIGIRDTLRLPLRRASGTPARGRSW